MNRRLLFIAFVLISITFIGCTQGTAPNGIAGQKEVVLSSLQSPFCDDGKSDWYMTQSFGAYYGDYSGHHPGEDWNRDSGNNDAGEDIYAIAPGVVVKTGEVSTGNGYYLILKHTGKFLIPSSSGPHLLSLIKPTSFDGRGHNQGNPILNAGDLFTESNSADLTDYVFEKEDKYSYKRETADEIYSVYMHIDKPDLQVGAVIKESDMNNPIGRLASLSGNNAHLHLEIRNKNAVEQLVLGGKGNGYFSDSKKMVDLGYREPSAIIQANMKRQMSQGSVLGTSTESKKSSSPSPTNQTGNKDDNVVPPGEGVYLVTNGKASEMVADYVKLGYENGNALGGLIFLGSKSHFKNVPSSSSELPIVLLKSSASPLPAIQLFRFYNIIGINLSNLNNQVVISEVIEDSGASDAGLKAGDIVLAVDGKEIAADGNVLSDYLQEGILNSQVSMKILRGTATLDINVIRKDLKYAAEYKYKLIPKGEYVQLVPEQKLPSGSYAYIVVKRSESDMFFWEGTGYYFKVNLNGDVEVVDRVAEKAAADKAAAKKEIEEAAAEKAAADKPTYNISDYKINVNINTDGSADVEERLTYNFYTQFNGIFREVDFSQTNGLIDQSVFVETNESLFECKLNKSNLIDDNGQLGTYNYSIEDEIAHFKIFESSYNEKKTFVIKYKLLDVVICYNDIAEFDRKLIGTNWQCRLDNINIKVVLPMGATREEIKVFVHGPLSGESKIINAQNVEFTIPSVSQGTFVETLVLFPIKLVPESTNRINEAALPRIMTNEEKLAEETNKQRE